MIVTPKSDTRITLVRECEVHPSVMIKIQHGDALRRLYFLIFKNVGYFKSTFAGFSNTIAPFTPPVRTMSTARSLL